MKHTLLFLSAAFLMASCGNDGGNAETPAGEAPAAEAPVAETEAMSPEIEEGLNLVAQSDCLSCHKIAEDGIGPAYENVAAKYPDTEENVTMLAGKIIKGGMGNWGQVMMTPHPDLKEEDAKKMVRYILSLK